MTRAREDASAPVPCLSCFTRTRLRARLMTVGGRLSDYCEHMSGGVRIDATVEHGAIVSWQYAAPAERPCADAEGEAPVSRQDMREIGRYSAA